MVYHRCPNCQTLLNIDPNKKMQRCKYCGTECTEAEARASYDDDGTLPERKAPLQKPVKKPVPARTVVPARPSQPARTVAPARPSQPARIVPPSRASGPVGYQPYVRNQPYVRPMTLKSRRKVAYLFALIVIPLVVLIGIMALVYGIKWISQPKKFEDPDAKDLKIRSIDGEVYIVFPKSVVEKYCRTSMEYRAQQPFVAKEYYQPNADRIIYQITEDEFFNQVIFDHPNYWGAVIWNKDESKSDGGGEQEESWYYEYFPTTERKKTVPYQDYHTLIGGKRLLYGCQLFCKDDHFFSVEYDNKHDFYNEGHMIADELALELRLSDTNALMYITFPHESDQWFEGPPGSGEGVYTVYHKYMTGFWDFEGLKQFYGALSDSCRRIDENEQAIYVRLRFFDSGGLSGRVAKVVPLEDYVEVTILGKEEGRRIFAQ